MRKPHSGWARRFIRSERRRKIHVDRKSRPRTGRDKRAADALRALAFLERRRP